MLSGVVYLRKLQSLTIEVCLFQASLESSNQVTRAEGIKVVGLLKNSLGLLKYICMTYHAVFSLFAAWFLVFTLNKIQGCYVDKKNLLHLIEVNLSTSENSVTNSVFIQVKN